MPPRPLESAEGKVLKDSLDSGWAKDEATLVWEVSIETPDPYYHMYQVCICAETGEVLQLHDLVNWVRVPCFSGPFEGRN